MKVFLDANILFSAANSRWLTRHLLDALQESGVQLCASKYVWDEAKRNVLEHFPNHITGLENLYCRLKWIEDAVIPFSLLENLPEKDKPVIFAAINGKCNYLLTGDFKHFGEWMGREICEVKIVSQRHITEDLF